MPLSTYREFEPALAYAAESTERTMDRLIPRGEAGEARVFEAMRYSSLGGGKRLRAFFVLASSTLFKVSETSALRVASAIEFVHAYSLIHDDLPAMDDDDLRRGKPSCHKQFDEATAILAGDALQALAFEVLAQEATHGDPAVRAALVSELAKAAGAQGMVGGQMLDLLAETPICRSARSPACSA
jgi:farnesyl diphosphate synthase